MHTYIYRYIYMHMYVKTYLHTDTHIKICIHVNMLKSYGNIHIPTKPQIDKKFSNNANAKILTLKLGIKYI
jgi:hypothetical protein